MFKNLLTNVSEETLSVFQLHFKTQHFKRNDMIYKAGDMPKKLYLIKEG